MKQNRWYSLLGIVGMFWFLISFSSQNVQAAETKRVLLVYDSLNIAEERENDVDALQRLLTSFGVVVQSISEEDYLPGQLLNDSYDGVISMVNWPAQTTASESGFIQDREKYTGKQFHIGLSMRPDEKKYFSGTWKELSHRQYRIEDGEGQFSQLLPFQDQSVMLENTSGKTFGKLITQELDPEEYPFGVVENGHGFIPFFSRKGAVFLESAQVLSEWLEIKKPSRPYLAIEGFNPMKNLEAAQYLQKELVKTSLPYILSSTSVSQNNTILPYKLFTDILRSFGATGVVFLEVPVVNNVNLNDNHALTQLLEQQISLLVDRNVFPVGVSAPGYWNQDEQYQADGLGIANTVILHENPPIDQVLYRSQSGESKVFETAFFNLASDYLDGIEWKSGEQQTDYKFPMPTTISFAFPNSKKEVDQVIKEIKNEPIIFKVSGNGYKFGIQTLTQKIEFAYNRFYLNGQLVNGLDDLAKTDLPQLPFNGLFARFFNITNAVLVILVVVTLVVLSVLFLMGRRNYRSKYINKGERK